MPRKAKKLPVAITKEEYEKLVASAKSPKHKLAFYLGFNSGLRISEVVNLQPNDIDLNSKRILIRQGKGSKDRIVPLPKGFLKKYLAILPLGIGPRALQLAFKRAADKSQLLVTKPTAHFHSLRHGFATHFLEKGGDIVLLKTLMGHTNIATTDIYNQLNPKVALEAYNELF
jgi:integrase/recombinase XerD